MNKKVAIKVGTNGCVQLPREVAQRYHLQPGTPLYLEEREMGWSVSRPLSHLAKVYIEPTTHCNLACRMCVRSHFDDQGVMTLPVFERLLEGVRQLPSPPKIFFGGFGEPLVHPHIVEMVAQAKTVAASVELITNGTLLDETMGRGLIAAGLDVLWVSIDGVTPQSYADVRLGAELPQVLANLNRFRQLRPAAHRPRPEIGISFVAMRRNIAELPALLDLGEHLGATRFLVTNVLPYTQEMCSEVLYHRLLHQITYVPSPWVPTLNMPRMEVNETTREPLLRALWGQQNLSLSGDNLGAANDRCPFILAGAVAVAWDGGVSPCLPLMHSHLSYLEARRPRFSRRYVVGNVAEHTLPILWNDPQYVDFRARVQRFEFAPCTFCGGCELSETNEEDCIGSTFPTCGGCLWAQGLIQCP